MIKKFIIFIFVLLFNITYTCAGGVGYVDYNKIVSNYNFAKTAAHELDIKASELQAFLAEKEKEYQQLESPVQKSKFEQEMNSEIQKREKAFNDFKERREFVVKQRIQKTIDKVREEKSLDIIISNENIYSGGIDITDTIIQMLNN